MQISEFYSRLLHENEEISKFDLSQIFEQALKIKLPFSFLSEEISEEAVAEIEKSLKRLKSGEPLQYILGEWEFYGLPFYVGEGVLIPRADTETLVDTAIPLIKSGDIIADFCAGSGAIAISLGKNTCAKKIYAVEFYEKAYYYLEKNIELNMKPNSKAPEIKKIRADVLKPLALEPLDMLISNPPYITGGEMEKIPQNVKYEPSTALFGGEDGLMFYRALALRGRELLKKNGVLILEIGFRQAFAVGEILKSHGYKNIEVIKDLTGNDRCIKALI